jgi:hypothetical protein
MNQLYDRTLRPHALPTVPIQTGTLTATYLLSGV